MLSASLSEPVILSLAKDLSCLLASVPVTDLLWGLAVFALGWLAIEFAEAYEHLAVNIRCACGRREMRDVLCDPQERAILVAELTKVCPWCAAANRQSAPRVYVGDQDGE